MNTKTITLGLLLMLALTACQESLEERCAREAREYTEKKCPALVTKDVTIDSVTFDQRTHTMSYYYTMGGVMDDAAALKQHDVRGMLLKELKNTTSMQLYKEAGYNFRYIYFSKKEKGKKLFKTTFKEKDYK